MRIYTDKNGLAVNAISGTSEGVNVEGHLYQVLAGVEPVAIWFQRGGVSENGVNGATNEALLAILIHRTQHLDAKFPCDENKIALRHMREALAAFESRAAARIERGVEGQEVA